MSICFKKAPIISLHPAERCSMHEEEDKCIQGFSRKSRRKQTTIKPT
jgi:hypothetical protein